MKVTLAYRHYGVHRNRAEAEIPGEFSDYATPKGGDPCDCAINEERLLAALPEGFLPTPAARVLLAIEDEIGGTGQTGLSTFRNWAKYFDAYCLNLIKEESRA